MNCYYCKQSTYFTKDKWYSCKKCRVLFGTQFFTEGLHIKWERKIGHLWCALNIYPKKNKTYLSIFNENTGDYANEEIIIDQIVVVNKKNIVKKIKTILTFQ